MMNRIIILSYFCVLSVIANAQSILKYPISSTFDEQYYTLTPLHDGRIVLKNSSGTGPIYDYLKITDTSCSITKITSAGDYDAVYGNGTVTELSDYTLAEVNYASDYHYDFKAHMRKYDALGNLLWDTQFSDSIYALSSVKAIETSDHSLLTYGYEYINGYPMSHFICKINSSGTICWKKQIPDSTIAGVNGMADIGNNQYLLISNFMNGQAIHKIDSSGNIIWKRNIDSSFFTYRDIHVMNNNSFRIYYEKIGAVYNTYYESILLSLDIDSSGVISNKVTLNSIPNRFRMAHFFINDIGFVDFTENDSGANNWINMDIYNSTGNLIFNNFYPFDNNYDFRLYAADKYIGKSLVFLMDTSAYDSASGMPIGSGFQIWKVVLQDNFQSVNTITNSENILSIYPNPASDQLVVSIDGKPLPLHLKLFYLNGKLIHEYDTEKQSTLIDISNINEGLYYLNYESSDKKITGTCKLLIRRN